MKNILSVALAGIFTLLLIVGSAMMLGVVVEMLGG